MPIMNLCLDGRETMRATLAVLCLLTTAIPAMAQQPLPWHGSSCPPDYYVSGAYCTPNADARPAIERSGACPDGYSAAGDYCIASRSDVKPALPRRGMAGCPSGYQASGGSCIKSR